MLTRDILLKIFKPYINETGVPNSAWLDDVLTNISQSNYTIILGDGKVYDETATAYTETPYEVGDESIMKPILEDEYLTTELHLDSEFIAVWAINNIASVASLIALVYGVSTWICLPKSRTFHNYVYLNSIFTLTVVLWLTFLVNVQLLADNTIYIIMFFEFAFLSWVAVAFVLIYRDIVIVYTTDVKRKFLKCNLFAWGLPMTTLIGLIGTGFVYFAVWYVSLLSVVLIVQVFLYVRVLYSLFESSKLTSYSMNDHCKRVQVATVTFFMGGIPLILEIIITRQPLDLAPHSRAMNILITILSQTPTIVYSILFIIKKSNRCLWSEWRTNNKRKNLSCIPINVTESNE